MSAGWGIGYDERNWGLRYGFWRREPIIAPTALTPSIQDLDEEWVGSPVAEAHRLYYVFPSGNLAGAPDDSCTVFGARRKGDVSHRWLKRTGYGTFSGNFAELAVFSAGDWLGFERVRLQ